VPDRKLIIATYDRLEEEAGGIWHALASMTMDKVAQELKIPRDEVREVMVSYWTNQGAG
jgi:NADH:ubiquinone oxidoreductase subunit E